MGHTQRIAGGSIALGLAVLALKTVAWWLTDSAALFSDALESVVNVAAAVIALVALRLAEKPADANHPYGHAKAEFFAAVIEGALIIVAAVSIVLHAYDVWRNPRPIEAPWTGMGLNLGAGLLNGVWAWVLITAGRRARSPALSADGRHLVTDVVSSGAILAGLAVVVWTGDTRLDPLLALAVAAYVLGSGLHLVGKSVGGLMDAAPEPEVIDRIRLLVGEHAAGALEVHDLRTRRAGRLTFMEFHLVVPGGMRVDEAHAICDRIEEALRRDMGELAITIHVEPEGKAKHHGVLVL